MTRGLRGDGWAHERPPQGVSNAAPIRYVLLCMALGAVLGLGGCALLPERRPAVPVELQEQASVAGLPGIRYVVGGQRERHLYVIRNARLDPDWADVERRALTIAQRTITSLIQTQGIGDLAQIYLIAERDGLDYNLAFISPSFKAQHLEEFDTAYMRQLFQVGYDLAAKGYPWLKKPPQF